MDGKLGVRGEKMTSGTLYYKNGTIRFVGSYEECVDGTEKYMAGTLYSEDGTLWMEGEFQRGGLRLGKQYYENGQLMFEGEYNDRNKGRYFGPPYPVCGIMYDESGEVMYKGKIPVGPVGGVGYPYLRLPDGSKAPIKGIPGDHADRNILREEHFKRTSDFGVLPTFEEFREEVKKRLFRYLPNEPKVKLEEYFRSDETQEMLRAEYDGAADEWRGKEITAAMIRNAAASSTAYCLWMLY